MKLAHFSRKPGQGVPPRAPLKLVTKLSEEKGINNVSLGNPDDAGTFWALIAGRVNGAEEFEFGVYKMEPDKYHPRHYHPEGAELYYITEGRCVVTLDDTEVEATPGTAIYIPKGTVHAVRTFPGESMTMVYVFPFSDYHYAGTNWLEE